MQSTGPERLPDDARLAKLAARQHGVVSWAQLLRLGFSEDAIKVRVAKGRLLRIHRGVYAVGHTNVSLRGRWMAAVLACGASSVLSHRDAATLHGIRPVSSGRIEVSALARHNLPGIRCHSVRALHPDDVTVVDGIPVTSVSRTLLDLAETLNRRQLRGVLEQADRERKLDLRLIDAVITRNPGRHGLKPLTAAIGELSGENDPWTQSELERRFLELLRAHGLPSPQVNVYVGGELVDCYWPDHNLVVEVDGWGFHRLKPSFEADRRKDAKLVELGRRVVRFTHDRVTYGSDGVVAQLRNLLRGEPWPQQGR